ncbi:MAG: LysM peptidoglycan-binding domain-containing protein [Actinomycetota bacterium]
MIARLTDLLKGIVSLALLLVLLIGIPALLLLIVGYPLPTEAPSVDLIRAHLESGDIPDQFIIKALALVVWLVWAQLAVAVLAEVFATVRGRVARRAPVLPGLQLMAGKLVASSVLIISALLPSRTATAAPIHPIDVSELAVEVPIGAPPGSAGASIVADVPGSGLLGVVGTEAGVDGRTAAVDVAPGWYETRNGDSWWDMAERLLGDGMRWSELRDLNSGRTMLTGELISNRTEDVKGGWQLQVPAGARADLLVSGSPETPPAVDHGPETNRAAPTAEDGEASAATGPAAPEAATAAGVDFSRLPPPTGADGHEPPAVSAEVDEVTAVPAMSDAADHAAEGEAVPTAVTDGPGTETVSPPEVGSMPGTSPSGTTDDDVHVSSPLIEAIKPFALVYEGPTGVTPGEHQVPYQVVAGDTLWDIAERHLGDPFRWPEIFENSNGLTQSFGRVISDPNLIWPDSIVLLPEGAVAVPTPDPELVAEVVGPLAHTGSGPAPDQGVGGPVTGDDDLGGVLRPEDLENAADAAEAGLSPESTSGGTPEEDPPDPDRPRGEESAEEDPSGLAALLSRPAGAAFGAGGLLVATGLLGLLRRSRRLRQTEAGPRTVPAPPPVELVDVETVLRNSADRRAAVSVHHLIASLADRPIVPGEPVATPEVIRIGADRVEVIQHGADPDLPPPWVAATNQTIEALGGKSLAVLPAESHPDGRDGEETRSAAPLCVTVGGGLLLNLEAAGVVAIDGTVEASASLVRSMVHELATGPARRIVDIRVSRRLPGADLHDHVRCGPLDDLVEELTPWFEDVDLGVTAAEAFSSYALRAAGDDHAIPNPKVIFADVSEVAALAPILARATRQTTPLAVVVTGDGNQLEHLNRLQQVPPVTVVIDGGTSTVLPYGVTAAVQQLDADLLLGAEALITHAGRAPMIHRDDDQATILPAADHPTDPANAATEETPEHEIVTEQPEGENEVTDQAEDGESGILIRVLGPVEIDGGPDDLSEEERSVLTFLALVGPSTSEQLLDAVWPDGAARHEVAAGDGPSGGADVDVDLDVGVADRTVASLRAKLGVLLPESTDGRHRVRSVITDLGSARRWLTQAQAMSGDRARNLMELALADVRGVPFDGVSPKFWQWIEDHRLAVATQATSLLTDACFDLCDAAYAGGELQLATWACEVAALVDPVHETVAIRRAQLLGVAGRHDDAESFVERWEAEYTRLVDRTAPVGPRSALVQREAVGQHVG